MVEKIISYTLVSSFLLNLILTSFSCKSFYVPVDDEDLQSNITSKNRLMIKLKDKSQLDLNPESYLLIETPSEFIYGIGNEFDFENKKESKFVGLLSKSEVDSTERFIFRSETLHKYWLKNNKRIIFEEGKVYEITPASGSGFWIVLDSDKDVLRKIDAKDIEEIQVRKTNWIASSFLFVVGIGLLALIIAAGQSISLDYP